MPLIFNTTCRILDPLQAPATLQLTSSCSSRQSSCHPVWVSISFSTPMAAGRRCDQRHKICSQPSGNSDPESTFLNTIQIIPTKRARCSIRSSTRYKRANFHSLPHFSTKLAGHGRFDIIRSRVTHAILIPHAFPNRIQCIHRRHQRQRSLPRISSDGLPPRPIPGHL